MASGFKLIKIKSSLGQSNWLQISMNGNFFDGMSRSIMKYLGVRSKVLVKFHGLSPVRIARLKQNGSPLIHNMIPYLGKGY